MFMITDLIPLMGCYYTAVIFFQFQFQFQLLLYAMFMTQDLIPRQLDVSPFISKATK